MTTLLLNQNRAVSVRLVMPWTGAWFAEVDFDLDTGGTVPSGVALLKVGDAVLNGKVSPDETGKFGEKGKARVVGGLGWSDDVRAQHFKNDAGVLSTAMLSATAAEVGELVTDLTPTRLGADYVRSAGPASRVFAGRDDWYVTTAGVTVVGPRPEIPAPTLEILEWDPYERRALIASDELVTPGMILVDVRFGTATVRDVEQTFGEGGARAVAYCGETGTARLGKALARFVTETAGTQHLKPYKYRIVTVGVDGRLTLQIASRSTGIPDTISIPAWSGVAGVKSTPVPGGEVLLVFADGDPSQPIVIAYDAKTIKVAVGEGASAVALATLVTAQLNALKAAISGAPTTAGDGGAAFKAALVTALSQWPLTVSSTKLFSD